MEKKYKFPLRKPLTILRSSNSWFAEGRIASASLIVRGRKISEIEYGLRSHFMGLLLRIVIHHVNRGVGLYREMRSIAEYAGMHSSGGSLSNAGLTSADYVCSHHLITFHSCLLVQLLSRYQYALKQCLKRSPAFSCHPRTSSRKCGGCCCWWGL